MTDKSTLIEFPCDFTIKIIGVTTGTFIADIQDIIFKHFPDTKNDHIKSKDSGKGNYTAITASVYAENQPSLDALYQELTSYPGIKMVL